MLELLQMWALVEALGFVFLPLTVTVFHNLPDRGWAFNKAIGIAVLAFFVWLPLMVFHVLPFSQLFIAGVLLILVALNIVGFVRVRQTLVKVIRVNLPYILATETVFGGMTFLLGWIRSYGPDIRSFEMFMDEGFLAGIMRSPHFPPNDMWYSGYPINYYYYAHYTIAMLAKLIGQPPSIAFNTGICMLFGLTAVSLFGVTCNIVAWGRHLRKRNASDTLPSGEVQRASTVFPPLWRAVPYGVLTIVMALLMGNLAGTQQWFQTRTDLTQFNWFNPSRVVNNTINEFPAFSFLLSCFHAHVLTLAFTIVAIALAFNLFMGGEGKGLYAFGRGWRLPLTLFTTALIIGGLFTMNGWDYPTYMMLAVLCIGIQQWFAYEGHLRWEFLLDIFTSCAGLVALSFIMFAPFYLNFISPSQGLGIVGVADRSSISQEVLIYGVFAFMFLSLLVASVFKLPFFNHSASGEDSGNAVSRFDMQSFLLNKGVLCILLLVGAVLITAAILRNSETFLLVGLIDVFGAALTLYHLRDRAQSFALLLGTTAFFLIALCEVFYLKDVFADSLPRMNTVFKFYFQAWALLSITAGAGLYFILDGFRPASMLSSVQVWLQWGIERLWAVGLVVLLLAGAAYPIAGAYTRTNEFAQRSNSLDGFAYMQTYSPGDYYAINWLNSNVSGDPVIIEAIGGDYTDYGRVSAFTGLPTPMGWIGHEYQWRVNWLNNPLNAVDFDNRTRQGNDIDTIYTDPHPNVVLSMMARYHAEYLYVGALEQAKYPTVNLHRFAAFMQVAYSADGVTIYKVG